MIGGNLSTDFVNLNERAFQQQTFLRGLGSLSLYGCLEEGKDCKFWAALTECVSYPGPEKDQN